jgi:hypothetical protein
VPASNILLAKNLPDECTKEVSSQTCVYLLSIYLQLIYCSLPPRWLQVLIELFKQYHGFKEIRMVPGKKGLAFVEFDAVIQSSNALQVCISILTLSLSLSLIEFCSSLSFSFPVVGSLWLQAYVVCALGY